MIPPALSAADWAAAYEREPDASLGFHPLHTELVHAADFGHYGQATALANAARRNDDPGKLTHAMADALAAFLRERAPFRPVPPEVTALADALASLLPPRTA